MAFPAPDFGLDNLEIRSSWFRRVVENFRLAVSPVGKLAHAGGASERFAIVSTNTHFGSAQPISMATHLVVVAGLLLILAAPPGIPPFSKSPSNEGTGPRLLHYTPPLEWSEGRASLGTRGRGGAEETLPARRGFLPPNSSLPLTQPRWNHSRAVPMPVAPAVLDAHAPAEVPMVSDLGLPWMKMDTNSGGPERGHGIGNRGGDGVGDDDGDGAGEAKDTGPYANVATTVACLYCPEPPYTDEARKEKLQGIVTLRVLVGEDGRAKRIHVVKGLGAGLDEQALETIRAWHFAPARDARRQPLRSWVTIETRFQLF